MLQRVTRAKIFATGPEDPRSNRHKFYCMTCCVNVSMRARGVYEIKKRHQNPDHLPTDQRLRESFCRKTLGAGR